MHPRPVELGPPVGDVLRVWGADGPRTWRAPEGDTSLDLLGRGRVRRASVGPGRSREVGLLVEEGGTATLLLSGRDGDPSAAYPDRPVSVPLVPTDHPDPEEAWPTMANWLGDACIAAAGRGEAVVVEPGGGPRSPRDGRAHADADAPPYAVFAATVATSEVWGQVEAVPAPPPDDRWWSSAARSTDDDGGTVASSAAPATTRSVGTAGLLLAVAASYWAAGPLDLVVTYLDAPAGPVALEP
jgi:hypothetical protein